jgi:hypothetical protein
MRPPLHKGGLQGGGWDCTHYLPLTPSFSKEGKFRNLFTESLTSKLRLPSKTEGLLSLPHSG